jgi:lipopolysaccharide export LptBFGC system permease protein LptF
MSKTENVASFIKENKEVLKEYAETRYEIYRLKGIRTVSKTAGFLGWIIISLFLLFLVVIFGGMTLAYWLSNVFGSTVMGFGITTLFLLVVFVLLAVFRKQFFINPVISTIISQSNEDDDN